MNISVFLFIGEDGFDELIPAKENNPHINDNFAYEYPAFK